MKKFTTALLITFFALVGISCSESDMEAAIYIKDEAKHAALVRKKQNFYRNNKEELRKKLDWCRAATKEDRKRIDCIAAAREVNSL